MLIGIWLVLSFCDICVMTVEHFVGCGGGDQVVRKTDTLPLICQKNQSRHYINNKISLRNWKKEWYSWCEYEYNK